jgi:hypothetical protein
MNKRKAIDDLKMLEGLPPYDDGGNICRGDGHFARSLEKKYHMTLEQLRREVGFDRIKKDWENHRNLFMGGGEVR